MSSDTATQYARLVAAPVAFALAGYSLSASQNMVCQLYDVKPQISTPIFKRVFYDGAVVVLPSVLVTTAANVYLAYMNPAQRREWSTAAVAVVSTLAWTRIVMGPGIKRLIGISEASAAEQSKVEQNLEHRQLLKTWVRHNYVRAICYTISGIFALRATLHS